MRSLRFFALLSFFIVAFGGCISIDNPSYPSDWPAIAQLNKGQCPNLEGRYISSGWTTDTCLRSGVSRSVYVWDCDTDLSSNLLSGRAADINRGRGSSWVELKQPDDNTLVIHLQEGGAPIILKRSDDEFACDDEGVVLSHSGFDLRRRSSSDIGSAAGTLALLMIGTGAGGTLSRSFVRLEDGSLLMKVSQSAVGAFLAAPVYESHGWYVLWPKFVPDGDAVPQTH